MRIFTSLISTKLCIFSPMKNMKFPTAQTILLIIAAFAAIATWIIPAGEFERLSYDADKNVFTHISPEGEKEYPGNQATLEEFGIKIGYDKFKNGDIWKPVGIPNTYHKQESKPQGWKEFFFSPIEGIKDSLEIILFVLIIGGLIGIVNYTGAFDAGVAWLAERMQGRETLLIVLITVLIALGGTTFGLAEETIAFYPILIPIFLAAGYDAMVGVAAIYIGSAIGTMCSTTNPFSAIVASDAAGINWTTGLYGRIFMLVMCTGFCLWYIIRYAERVRKDPSKSIIYSQKEEIEEMFLKSTDEKPEFTFRKGLVLSCFASCFIVMIAGVSMAGWYFHEMILVFIIGTFITGLVSQIGERKMVEEFMRGAKDLLSVALIIGLARGIGILLDNGLVSDTLLHHSSGLVEGMPKGIFVNVMMFLYAGLSFFIPSSSGMAILTMPIIAPLGDVVEVGREHIINAYQYGMGLMAFITPTGLILASLAMVNVTYDKWLKFVMPLLGWLTAITMVVMTSLVYFT